VRLLGEHRHQLDRSFQAGELSWREGEGPMILTWQPCSTSLLYSSGSSGWCLYGSALLNRPTVKALAEAGPEDVRGAGTNLSMSIREGWTKPG
jgi:hypothetical protein